MIGDAGLSTDASVHLQTFLQLPSHYAACDVDEAGEKVVPCTAADDGDRGLVDGDGLTAHEVDDDEGGAKTLKGAD